MRYSDIKVGQKYRVKEDVVSYIKRGAVVVIKEKDGEFSYVQDLSKNKYLNGCWWLHNSRLEPLKGIDPEEIKEGLRVHHKECGKGTVDTVFTEYFVVKWDEKPLDYKAKCNFSRGGRFRWDDQRLWSCEELTILNEEEKLDGHREGNKIIFTLVKGDKTIEASASCSPDDTLDYITGSQIALARLAQKCGKPAKVYLPKDTKDFQIEFI